MDYYSNLLFSYRVVFFVFFTVIILLLLSFLCFGFDRLKAQQFETEQILQLIPIERMEKEDIEDIKRYLHD